MSLEPGRQHLVVAHSLTDVGGPRNHTRPVSGLPLIPVETPKFEDGNFFATRALDVAASGRLIAVLSPFLLAIAMVIRLSAPGDVLLRQERRGINGRHFSMFKFRSVVTNAKTLLVNLQEEDRDIGNEVMFKMKGDPLFTPIGKFLRRYSLDELPPLFNFLGGAISLVSPRPPLKRYPFVRNISTRSDRLWCRLESGSRIDRGDGVEIRCTYGQSLTNSFIGLCALEGGSPVLAGTRIGDPRYFISDARTFGDFGFVALKLSVRRQMRCHTARNAPFIDGCRRDIARQRLLTVPVKDGTN